MREIIADVDRWKAAGREIAVATVVETWGSAPRAAGAKLAMTDEGEISGSVSGGCVEGAVVESGLGVLRSGESAMLHFGVADETAWEVGLACGGNIDIFVQRLDPTLYEILREAIHNEELVARVTFIRGGDDLVGREVLIRADGTSAGRLPDGLLEPLVSLALEQMRKDPSRPHASRRVLVPESGRGEVEVLVEVYPPPPTLILIGGVHIAVTLVSLARTLGFRTIVIDPRRAFATEERFSHADRLYSTWPQEAFQEVRINTATAICMLTHDPKIDDPALMVALESEAFYIGALGSQRTQEKRRARLGASGVSEGKISRIHGPIGLPLGGRNPDEIALAIMAQIVGARNLALDEGGFLQQTSK